MIIDKLFNYYCRRGYLWIAKLLYFIDPTIDIAKHDANLFKRVCENGHFEVAKWLLSVEQRINSYNSFFLACINGHLNVAQWLLSERGSRIDVSDMDNFIFNCTCKNGHLHVAKWLYQIEPNSITSNTISYYDYCGEGVFVRYKGREKAFGGACFNGHLHVAQWLLSVKPSIDVSNDDNYAFNKACLNRHLNVAQWLCTLNPFKYSLTIKYGIIIDWKVNCNEHDNNVMLLLFLMKTYNYSMVL